MQNPFSFFHIFTLTVSLSLQWISISAMSLLMTTYYLKHHKDKIRLKFTQNNSYNAKVCTSSQKLKVNTSAAFISAIMLCVQFAVYLY